MLFTTPCHTNTFFSLINKALAALFLTCIKGVDAVEQGASCYNLKHFGSSNNTFLSRYGRVKYDLDRSKVSDGSESSQPD